MTTGDPWAAADKGNAGQQQATAPGAPLAAHRALNPNANPFATPDAINSGGGVRGPRVFELIGRLIVLEPLEYLTDQPKPNSTNGETQNFWSTNMTVLTGGTLEIVTPAKPANGDQPALAEQRNAYQPPFTFPRWYAFGASFTAKLNGLKETGLPLLLGTVQRCPTGAGYRSGKTWQQVTAEYAEWEERVKQVGLRQAGNEPQFSWGLIDPTEEEQALALSWYQAQNAAA